MFGLIFHLLVGCLLVFFGLELNGIKDIVLIVLGLFNIIMYAGQLYELATGKNIADIGRDAPRNE